MKKSILLIVLLAAWLNGMRCYSQSDTVLLETEFSKDQDFLYRNKYRYLDVRLSDEDRLLKIGIQPFKPGDNFNFMIFALHGGLEQKVNTSFSVLSEINSVMTWSGSQAFHQQGLSIGSRYYFTKKKDIQLGRSGNNCQGFYGLFKMSDLLSLMTLRLKGTDPDPSLKESQFSRNIDFALTPEIGIGFQQRLDYHLYFDAGISCSYNILENEPGFQISFLFGGIFSYTK